MKKKIGIIGAGLSGLLVCKHALKKGFDPIVFEARSEIGGIWNQTIESTKLQTPRPIFEFSDFPWPFFVKETFPDHNQVMEYLKAYAKDFNILPRIKFNTRVTCIDYVSSSDHQDMSSWDLWGGTGYAFSPIARWDVFVQDARYASAPIEVYQMDFVIVCNGRFSDLPNLPDFPINKGPEVFGGQVLHSEDYAAMDDRRAADFVNNKRVIVAGLQKSALDLAVEVADRNGVNHPCTIVFRTVHWLVPESLLLLIFKCFTRFTELMIHKPGEGFFSCLLACLLSPLIWIFAKSVEWYLKWKYPLKEFNMVPSHGFVKQVFTCMFSLMPSTFFRKVKEGSIILKKSTTFSFCKDGLILEGEEDPLPADIVIFATGFKGDDRIKNLFKSDFFQKCIIGSSAPFFRDCIHPRIPQLAIVGYAVTTAFLYTTEIRSKWVAHFLAGKFRLPSISEMEAEGVKWETNSRCYSGDRYSRYRVVVLLQTYANDLLCKDMGYNPKRKKGLMADLFSAYGPSDYKYLGYDEYNADA